MLQSEVMRTFKFWLISMLSVVAGVGAGLLILFLLPRLPLFPYNPLYKLFGIRKPEVVGFLPYWLIDKADKKYPDYLTNYTYFGLELNSDGTVLQKIGKDGEPGFVTLSGDKLAARISEAKKLGIMASLLVHNSKESSISALIADPQKHADTLIQQVGPYMKKYGYTDLNLDIESFHEASPAAQQQFTAFVSEVKKGMDQNQLGTLSVDVTGSSLVRPQLMNPQAVGQIADQMILMAYDYYYLGSAVAGPVSPIHGNSSMAEFDLDRDTTKVLLSQYDVTKSVEAMTKAVSPDKILLGLPLYGYEWETLSYQPGSPVIPGTGKTASERRVEDLLTKCATCSAIVDSNSQEPYLILPPNADSSIQQIFYEDGSSLAKKLELAQKYHLRGVAFWAIGYEGNSMLQPLKMYKQNFEWE